MKSPFVRAASMSYDAAQVRDPGCTLIPQQKTMSCWYACAQMHWFACLTLAIELGSCRSETKQINRRSPEVKTVEIVPGKAIGSISLGAVERDLPAGALVANGIGSVDHVQFSLESGRVDDVWIDDLATFPYDLLCRGQLISHATNLERLKSLLGECARAPGILGGTFYNCRGITSAATRKTGLLNLD